MKVYRYTPEVQKEFKLPIKPEPWLHCAVYMSGGYTETPCIAIWVWDTRQIVYDKGYWANYAAYDNIQALKHGQTWLAEHAPVANDNHRPLKGKSVSDINEELARTRLSNKTANFAVVSGKLDNWLNLVKSKFTGKVIGIDSFDKAYALFSKTVKQWFDEHRPMWTPANFDKVAEDWEKAIPAKRANRQGISVQQAIKAMCDERNAARERSIAYALDHCDFNEGRGDDSDIIAIISTALKPLKDITPGSTINMNRPMLERGIMVARDAKKQQSK